MARIEHVEIDSSDLNQGFEKIRAASQRERLALAATPRLGFHCRKNPDYDDLRRGVARHASLRTVEKTKDLRKQREDFEFE